ncbi:MAG: radical SAM protein [Sedimentisphaerales bacterium]|nr:radical SAM protein [Sedimentisphaerales bacterium]
MKRSIFQLDTLKGNKFICDAESGRWVVADYIDESVVAKISRARPQGAYRGMALVLLNVTRACNFDCVYCLIGSLKQEGRSMPYDVARRAIDRVMELPEEDRYVIFHGSEPMMNFALIKRLLLHSHKNGYKIRYAMQSNGSLFDRENIDFLVEMETYIGISLDGTREHHNRNRPYAGGMPSYDDVMANVHLVIERQGGMGVICVVTKANVNSLERIVENLESEGITAVSFCPVSSGNKDIAANEEDLIRNMVCILDRYFLAKLSGTATIEIENARKYLINLAPRTSPVNCVQCSIGSKYPLLGVDVNGDIYPCDYFWGQCEYLLGNIQDDSFDSVINKPRDFRAYRDVNDMRGCSKCDWRRFCGGGCPGTFVLQGKSVATKSPYCNFHRAMLQYMARRIPLLHEKGLVREILGTRPSPPFGKHRV